MKHYLIRAGLAPTDEFDAATVIGKNSIGSNSGNLLYAFSLFRTIMRSDVQLTPDYYEINRLNVDYINETYDGYIIPLADAFRSDFVEKLRSYTDLIKKLTIPVIVVGVGLRTGFEPKKDKTYEFDQDVKAFCEAVLEKSSIIGVRGQITADYLGALGFKEEVDYTVIGCPSMYANGRHLDVRPLQKIDSSTKVSINNSAKSPQHVLDFMHRSLDEFDDSVFVPQWLRELRMVYLGGPDVPGTKKNYPYKSTDPLYQQDRIRYFIDVRSWRKFMTERDLVFGTRLHGNVAAMISNTPSIIIPKDGRMRELAEYHQMNMVYANDINDQTTIYDLVERSDFHSISKVAPQNFDRFIAFLNKNGIEHHYSQVEGIPYYLDEVLDLTAPKGHVENFYTLSEHDRSLRWMHYVEVEKEIQRQNYLRTIQKLETKNDFQRRTLQRKSVQVALKTADIVAKKNFFSKFASKS